jgi:hypothetical protein
MIAETLRDREAAPKGAALCSPRLRRGVALRGTTPTGMVTDPLAEPGAEITDAKPNGSGEFVR